MVYLPPPALGAALNVPTKEARFDHGSRALAGLFQCVRHGIALFILKCQERRLLQKRLLFQGCASHACD